LNKNKQDYEIKNESLILKGIFRTGILNGENHSKANVDNDDSIILNRDGDKLKYTSIKSKKEVSGSSFFRLGKKSLIIERNNPNISLDLWHSFSKIKIYDFDPKILKKAMPVSSRAELEEDGNNLSIVLKDILRNNHKKKDFLYLLKDMLPFIEKLNVEKLSDKFMTFNLREIYFEKQYLPASLMSDGTINITALIVAILFGSGTFTILEEPERNIHPYLISKILNFLKEASEKKSILVTTHNVDVVKNCDIKDLLLVSRDKDGFSTVSRPSDNENVKAFLKNDLGVEDLFLQNLLQ
jgi:AAA15 family ATPase/GTPase